MIPKIQYFLKHDANNKPYFVSVDHGDGRRASIRSGAQQVFVKEVVQLGEVKADDWFVDDVRLGAVQRIEKTDVRFQDGPAKGFKVWTALAKPEVWADQKVRVFRPVAMPLGSEAAELLADPRDLRFTAEELGAVWEVLNRFVGGDAVHDKGTPLNSVLAKFRTTTLEVERPCTMRNVNTFKRPHAVLEFVNEFDDFK